MHWLVVHMKSRSPRDENVALGTWIDFLTKYLQFKYTVDRVIKPQDLRNFTRTSKIDNRELNQRQRRRQRERKNSQ